MVYKEVYENGKKYLVINRKEPELDFNEKMLIANKIDSLLDLDIRYINDESFLYFNTRMLSNLIDYTKEHKLSGEEIAEILESLSNLYKIAKEHLLSLDSILLAPELIYYSKHEGKAYFSMFSAYPDDNGTNLLAEFLLENSDLEDKKASEIVYSFLEMSYSNDLDIDSVLAGFEKEISNCEVNTIQNNMQDEAEVYCDFSFGEEIVIGGNSDKKTKQVLGWIVFLIVLLACYICGFLYFNTLYNFGISKEMYLTVGALLIGLIVFVAIKYISNSLSRVLKTDIHEREDVCENKIDDKTALLLKHPIAVLAGEYEGKEVKIYLDKNPYIIGKSVKKADGIIEFPEISRIHIMISKEKDEFYVTDLGSKNGTILNGNPLIPHETYKIENKDSIMLAMVKLTFIDTSHD